MIVRWVYNIYIKILQVDLQVTVVFFSTEKGEFPQITAVTALSQAAAVTAYLQEEAFGSPKMGGCHTAYLFFFLGKPPESIC